MDNLADIESLIIRCRSDQSKEYISEANRCYNAGAYRAAIVNTWIAVVFDLIDKIRELSLAGDATAKAIETEHEKYMTQIEQNNPNGVKKALEFEREIIETCRNKLNFFDPQQLLDLERLRQDRHRCAHPSFQRIGMPYSPPAEQARLHIRNAIIHVLSQPPVQGKALLAELKALVSSQYFPIDKEQAKTQLKNAHLPSASEPSIKGFIDLLVFSFLDRNDPLFYDQRVYSALSATFEFFPRISEERLRRQLNKVISSVPDELIAGACALATCMQQNWTFLEQASRDKISLFIEQGPVEQVIPSLEYLSGFPELKKIVTKRVSNLSFIHLSKAIESHGLRAMAKDRALEILSSSRSWDSTNSIFDELVLPIFGLLNKDDITRIIRMPTESQADLPGAHAYSIFIKSVRESAKFTDDELNELLSENGASYLTPAPRQ